MNAKQRLTLHGLRKGWRSFQSYMPITGAANQLFQLLGRIQFHGSGVDMSNLKLLNSRILTTTGTAAFILHIHSPSSQLYLKLNH